MRATTPEFTADTAGTWMIELGAVITRNSRKNKPQRYNRAVLGLPDVLKAVRDGISIGKMCLGLGALRYLDVFDGAGGQCDMRPKREFRARTRSVIRPRGLPRSDRVSGILRAQMVRVMRRARNLNRER